MKYIVALLLIVALVCAPYTVELTVEAKGGLPWKTFSESVADSKGASVGQCAGQDSEVLYAVFERDGKTYLYWTGGADNRFVFAELDASGSPVRIYAGKQLPSPDHDKIAVTDEHEYNAERDAGGPCASLFPQRA